MEHIQSRATSVPHIVQVYQTANTNAKLQNPQIITIAHPALANPEGKLSYQQTITSESLHIPVTTQHVEVQNQQIQMSHNQIVVSCHQTNLHTMQPLQTSIQTQVLQTDMTKLQIAPHLLVPSVFKQHVILNGVQHQYYGQLEHYLEDQRVITKIDPEQHFVEKENEEQMQSDHQISGVKLEHIKQKKKARSQFPNPTKWACNVRKLKHQSGEAYISRRGKYVPERKVQNRKDCLTTCKFKCNERISDVDREHIFKAFYSLNANEKRHFLLNTTERHYVRRVSTDSQRRKYSFKYFFLVRAIRHTVCKNFYLGTLAISQKPVYNVHLGKSEKNIPKPDGRGLSEASTHSLPNEVKDKVRKHISSFKTVESKPVKQYSRKRQYLDSIFTVKQMYLMYVTDCNKENIVPVKESMYRKIFKQDFNLNFKRAKSQQLCSKCKGPIKKE